jgi:hypothetical protein
MAEKEERIYLFTDKLICENCKDWYEHIDPLDSPDCTECAPADFPYITRKEAINVIAKALHRESTRISNMEKDFDKLPADWRKSFYNYAETALNALLEADK